MNTPGIITIKLEGVTFQETERCRQIIHELFVCGFFSIRNGNFMAHFDNDGIFNAGDITLHWRRDKKLIEPKLLEQFSVETVPVDNSTVARRY